MIFSPLTLLTPTNISCSVLKGKKAKNAFSPPMTSMEVYKGFIIGQIRPVPKRAFCPAVRFRVASPFREDQRLNVHTEQKYGAARWSPITPRQRLSLSMCPEIRNPVSTPPHSASRMYCVLISATVTLWKNWKILRKLSLFQTMLLLKVSLNELLFSNAPAASPETICLVWWPPHPATHTHTGPDRRDSYESPG